MPNHILKSSGFSAVRRICFQMTSFSVVTVSMLGCGAKEKVASDRAVVSGAVTFNGNPLPAGTISFASTTVYGGASVSIIDGRYSTDRANIGPNSVTIDTATIKYGNPAKYVEIPAKYADPSKSGLTIDVKSGENENVDFNLTK